MRNQYNSLLLQVQVQVRRSLNPTMTQHGDLRLWTSSHFRDRGSISSVRCAVLTPADLPIIISITTLKIRKNKLSAV